MKNDSFVCHATLELVAVDPDDECDEKFSPARKNTWQR